MRTGLLAKKVGMTRLFGVDGSHVGVTVLQVEDCEVVAVRTPDGVWPADAEPVNRSYQRHLLQLGYVDAFLGRLCDRLKEAGLYDRALVVVTADHGCSFRPGDSYRDLTRANYPDVLRVPLLVKAPGQRQGAVCERVVQTTVEVS